MANLPHEKPEHWTGEMKNLELGWRLTGYNFQHQSFEVLWEVQLLCAKKGDLVTLSDLAEIETKVAERYKETLPT